MNNLSNFISLFILFSITSLLFFKCKDELSDSKSKLTINEARIYFQKILEKTHGRFSNLRTGESEELKDYPLAVNWNSAISYFNDATQESVVEANLDFHSFSKICLFEDQNQQSNNQFCNSYEYIKLIISMDYLGNIDYAFMKIVPLMNSNFNALNTNNLNSYNYIDPNFKGIVAFVDLDDQLIQLYHFIDTSYYLIDSLWKGNGINLLKTRLRVWCYPYTYYTACGCRPHHSFSEKEDCRCGIKPTSTTEIICWTEADKKNNRGKIEWNNPKNENKTNGGNGFNFGGTFGGSASAAATWASQFDSECTNYSTIAEFEDEVNLCAKLSKDYLAFKKCITENLLLKNSLINQNCIKNYLKEKYGLTEEEWIAFGDKNYYYGNETVVPTDKEQLFFKLCPESINREKIQNAYYVKLINFDYIFKPIYQPFKSYQVSIPNICFQVPANSNIHDFSNAVKHAAEIGVDRTLIRLNTQHNRNNPATQALILEYLKNNIREAFFEKFPPGPSSISFGSNICPGVIGKKTLWCL